MAAFSDNESVAKENPEHSVGGDRIGLGHDYHAGLKHFLEFFRDKGYQSRPTQVHGIDIVTDKPHVFAERTEADEADRILKPGMIIMAEPNPITADGMFGIFLGHTFIVTADGHECVDNFPLQIAVAEC